MIDSNNLRPFLSENARGEEAGKLETATRSQKSNVQAYVMTSESKDGARKSKFFDNREDAMDALLDVKKKHRKMHTSFEKFDEMYCEEAIIDKRGNVYAVQILDEAIDPSGKYVFIVQHSVYNNASENDSILNWSSIYSTPENAYDLFQRCLEYYKKQADKFPEIKVEMANNERTAIIYYNGKIAAKLCTDYILIGNTPKVGLLYFGGDNFAKLKSIN